MTPALAVVATEQPRVCDVLCGASLAYDQIDVGFGGAQALIGMIGGYMIR